MIHKGEVIEKAVRASGMSITKIADKLGKSRRWMYLLFENPHVSTDVILQVGKIIHEPFTELLQNPQIFEEDRANYEIKTDVEYWKQKYYALLEEHLEMMKGIKNVE
jgi:predicted transcriptional regulator